MSECILIHHQKVNTHPEISGLTLNWSAPYSVESARCFLHVDTSEYTLIMVMCTTHTTITWTHLMKIHPTIHLVEFSHCPQQSIQRGFFLLFFGIPSMNSSCVLESILNYLAEQIEFRISWFQLKLPLHSMTWKYYAMITVHHTHETQSLIDLLRLLLLFIVG